MPYPLFVLIRDSVVLREIPFTGSRLTIGRSPRADVCINDAAISASHAEIVRVDEELILQDLNSTNGTKVSGQPVHRHYLRDGDIIRLAGFELHYKADNVSGVGADVHGHLRVLDGQHQGRTLVIGARPLTVGDASAHAIVFADGSGTVRFAIRAEADTPTEAPKELSDGDTFVIAGMTFQFMKRSPPLCPN